MSSVFVSLHHRTKSGVSMIRRPIQNRLRFPRFTSVATDPPTKEDSGDPHYPNKTQGPPRGPFLEY